MTELPPPPYGSDPEQEARLVRQVRAQLAAQAAGRPGTMASLLAAYRRQEGLLSDERLAERLALDIDSLHRLQLCLRPTANSPLFREQVQQIADFVGMDVVLLANVVRQVDALASMESAAGPQVVHTQQTSPQISRQALFAARDREADAAQAPAAPAMAPPPLAMREHDETYLSADAQAGKAQAESPSPGPTDEAAPDEPAPDEPPAASPTVPPSESG